MRGKKRRRSRLNALREPILGSSLNALGETSWSPSQRHSRRQSHRYTGRLDDVHERLLSELHDDHHDDDA